MSSFIDTKLTIKGIISYYAGKEFSKPCEIIGSPIKYRLDVASTDRNNGTVTLLKDGEISLKCTLKSGEFSIQVDGTDSDVLDAEQIVKGRGLKYNLYREDNRTQSYDIR